MYSFSNWKAALKAIADCNALKACVAMTLALCFHFFGYECSRAASISLIAAKDVGLGNEAIPLTIAIGSPSSALVLYLYTKSIKKYGAVTTLRVSNIICTLLMLLMFLCCSKLNGIVGKAAVVSFYAFREIYVSLLSSQHWAFIASTLDRSTSSYIVSFSGVVSVASAVGGCSIEQIVGFGGVHFLLFSALLSTAGSFLCAEIAHVLLSDDKNHHSKSSHKYAAVATAAATTAAVATTDTTTVDSKESNEKVITNADDTDTKVQQPAAKAASTTPDTSKETSVVEHSKSQPNNHQQQQQQHQHSHSHSHHRHRTGGSSSSSGESGTVSKKRSGFWIDSWNLVWKHRLLQILFFEAITHQLCGNMLNLMFHNGLRSEIADNSTRAMLVGRFFATVNIAACLLQCFVLPHVLHQSTLPSVLMKIPFLVLIGVALGIVQPSLMAVMLGFGTIKVLEYSIMHSSAEMIYMPTSHEVRYLGKELIKFFGHKLGKSGASLVLSALVSHVQPSLCMQSIWGAVLTLFWGGTMYTLSEHLMEREKLLLLDTAADRNEMQRVLQLQQQKQQTQLRAPSSVQSSSNASNNIYSSSAESATAATSDAGAVAVKKVDDNSEFCRLQPAVEMLEDDYRRCLGPPRALASNSNSSSQESISPALTHYSAATTASCTSAAAYATYPSFQSLQSTDSLLSRGTSTYFTDSDAFFEDDEHDDSSYTDASIHSGRNSAQSGLLLSDVVAAGATTGPDAVAAEQSDGRTIYVSQKKQRLRRSSDSADENSHMGLYLEEDDGSSFDAAAAAARSLALNTIQNSQIGRHNSSNRRRRRNGSGSSRFAKELPQDPPIMLRIGSEQVSLNRLGKESQSLRRRAQRGAGV